MRDRMLIGALADATGVGVETLRFYERERLLPEPPRTDAGYRLYDQEAVRRVRFILKARELGFTLSETSELLTLRVGEGDRCDEVADRAREKVRSVERRIRELEGIRRVLGDLVHACEAEERTDACPVLDALDESAAIELIHFEGCPNADRARANLRAALGEEGEWREWDLTDDATPERYRRHGSPTVLIDGKDVTGTGPGTDAMACRADGAPSVQTIRAALAGRNER